MPEAELLLGAGIADGAAADAALNALFARGPAAVLLKGGHLDEGNAVVDRYADAGTEASFLHARLPLLAHGTGCTLASAIATNLCLGLSMPAAAQAASDYVERALRLGYRPGRGEMVVLDHFGATPLPRR
jgi:hydroxymethylpyrimidine/phosphomethylpyrimidine kinase